MGSSLDSDREKGKKCLLEPGRLFLIASANSNF